MAQVFEVYVRRARSAQPREYESSSAEVGLKANILEGEDWQAETEKLLASATQTVYKEIGLKVSGRTQQSVTQQPAGAGQPGQAAGQPTTATTAGTDKPSTTATNGGHKTNLKVADLRAKLPSMKKEELEPLLEDSRQTVRDLAQRQLEKLASKSDDIPDDEPPETTAAAAPPAGSDDIPDDDEPPAAAKPATGGGKSDDIPDDEPKPAAGGGEGDEVELTAGDVQKAMASAVNNRGLSVQACKAILKAMGVERARDVPAERRKELLERIDLELGE